jgi:hypothetical protein
MRIFILSCLAAIAIATIAVFCLDSFQEGVSVAFATEAVRV